MKMVGWALKPFGPEIRKILKAFSIGVLFTAMLGAAGARADVIPYPNPGTANPHTYTFAAASTGEIFAYFYGFEASYTETIGLLVNGVSTGFTGLQNHTSSFGQSLDLGFAHAGDSLIFTLQVLTTGDQFFTKKSMNSDGFQHAYVTSYSGGGGIPAGAFLAFEDIKGGGDKDYNDTSFVVTNVVFTAAPEISTWIMMLIGFAGLGFLARRRVRARAAAAVTA